MLAAAALMTGVTGCSNDDNVDGVPDNGDATLVVKLPSDAVLGSRAVQKPVSTGTTTKLDDVLVFFLNGNSVVKKEAFDNTDIAAGYKRFEQVSAAINRVIVVANIPTSTDANTLKAYTNSAEILSHPYTTADQNPANVVDGEEIDHKVLVGDANNLTSVTDPNPDGHTIYKEVSVTLDALTARFEIGTVTAGEGIESIALVGVWINKFYANGKKDAGEIVNMASTEGEWETNPATTIGTGSLPGTITIPTWVAPEYFDDGNDKVNENGDKAYAYHVFAGNNVPQLILLVKGEFADGAHDNDNDKYFLGYVTFTKFNDGSGDISSIDANTIYKVGVAGGIEITSDLITDKPNLGQIDLGIEVIVAPWTAKTVTPGV